MGNILGKQPVDIMNDNKLNEINIKEDISEEPINIDDFSDKIFTSLDRKIELIEKVSDIKFNDQVLYDKDIPNNEKLNTMFFNAILKSQTKPVKPLFDSFHKIK